MLWGCGEMSAEEQGCTEEEKVVAQLHPHLEIAAIGLVKVPSSAVLAIARHVRLGYDLFPLTPALSLGEREVRTPSFEYT